MSFLFQLISFHVIHVERFPKSKNYDFSLGKPFIEEVFKSGLKSGEQGGTLENSRLVTEKDLAQSHKLHPYHVKYVLLCCMYHYKSVSLLHHLQWFMFPPEVIGN